MGPRTALAFGVVSMATNITTLALVVPAAKEVAASDLGPAGRAVAVIVLVVLASIPAWSPVALTEVAPGPAERGLRALSDLIRRRGRLLTVACLAGVRGAAGAARDRPSARDVSTPNAGRDRDARAIGDVALHSLEAHRE